MNDIDIDNVYHALFLLATGGETSEQVEEYVSSDGELVLKSRKIITKKLAPDLSAIKLFLASGSSDYSDMTEEELKEEKEKLIKLLGLS